MVHNAAMTQALQTPQPPSQPHQSVGARLLRSLGGPVRTVIAGCLTLSIALRRPAASRGANGHAVAQYADARPAPGRAQRTSPRRAASPAASFQPARPGRRARWLNRWRRPASSSPAPCTSHPAPEDPDAPFTPQAYPGLSPGFCALLNTPLEECDSATISLLLDASARTIARVMPPQPGMPDAAALFATLSARLAGVFDDAGLDMPPIVPPAVLASVRKQFGLLETDSEQTPNPGTAHTVRRARIKLHTLIWDPERRTRRDRSFLRYPTDLTNEEWAAIAPFIPPARRRSNTRTVDIREVANGVLYSLGTGCEWREIPKDLPPRSTLHDYLKRWTRGGTLARMQHALYPQCRQETPAVAIERHSVNHAR